MLFFRHVGKTSLIPPPTGGLTATIVAVARRRKEYHVVAAVEGHELKAPETATIVAIFLSGRSVERRSDCGHFGSVD
jgi:hypothetical protein